MERNNVWLPKIIPFATIAYTILMDKENAGTIPSEQQPDLGI